MIEIWLECLEILANKEPYLGPAWTPRFGWLDDLELATYEALETLKEDA